MRDRKKDAELAAKLYQQAQQRDRVCPAGDSDGHAVSRAQQFPFADVMQDLVAHWLILRQRRLLLVTGAG